MENPATAAHPRWFTAYLMLTAVVCGALVMVVEVLGSRVIGPFFGVSLFVWTALIAVALAALSAGYLVGGWLADRHPSADVLYGLLVAAAAGVLVIPLLKAPVILMSQPLGLRAGSLTATAILFGPSLFALGCVSPYVVKIVAREMHRIGRTVGSFYALSTLGSVLGTVATGFWLIAWLGVDRIFFLVGALLIALALGYFIGVRRRWWALAALPLLLIGPPAPLTGKTLADGTRVTVLERTDSHYGNLKVVEYRTGDTAVREMLIDGLIQGGVDPATGLSVFEYVYAFQFLPRALVEAPQNALVVGLGAGLITGAYAQRGIVADAVEIDPEVARLARDHFGFRTNGELFVADARQHLIEHDQRYDIIILDAYTGDVTPIHLMSREAVALLKSRLKPGGVLGVNLAGQLRKDNFITASAVRTLRAEFDQVEMYPLFDWWKGDDNGNIAVVAYQGPPRAPRWAAVAGEPVHPMALRGLDQALQRPFRFPEGTPAMVLTDDFNPADVLDAAYREHVRNLLLRYTDWDLLLG